MSFFSQLLKKAGAYGLTFNIQSEMYLGKDELVCGIKSVGTVEETGNVSRLWKISGLIDACEKPNRSNGILETAINEAIQYCISV